MKSEQLTKIATESTDVPFALRFLEKIPVQVVPTIHAGADPTYMGQPQQPGPNGVADYSSD